MKKHYRVFFSGNVQGVGFRYAARSLADKHGIYGWVANLGDGRVELDIEGKTSDLNNFLSELKEEFKEYIKNIENEELARNNEYEDFSIKLY